MFCSYSKKNYVVTPDYNYLGKAVQLRGLNLMQFFYLEIKTIPKLSLKPAHPQIRRGNKKNLVNVSIFIKTCFHSLTH